MIKWIRAFLVAAIIFIVFVVVTITVGAIGSSVFGYIDSAPMGMAIVSALVLTGLIAYVIKDDV